MNYYISDTHFGHKAVLTFDQRPFTTLTEMETVLITNWNNKVTNKDTVYILGDFCFGKEPEWLRILSQLKGNKVLIKGNHDLTNMSNALKNKFQDIKDYKEIDDTLNNQTVKVILSHYPIPFYKKDYSNKVYHLYGHLHNTLEETYMQGLKKIILNTDTRGISSNKCQFYNCWCGFYNYTPVTLKEIISKWSNISEINSI